jgi:cytochrome c oxidase subunit III
MIWVMIGFHSAHVFTVVLKTIIVDVLAWRGYFNEHRNLGVGVNGVYWHFVVIIWIPLYLTIYWAPRLWP